MTTSTRVSTRVWMQRLRDDPDITKVRLATLLTLGTFMSSDGSNGRVRESTIAEAVGITERAVRDHLADARADGYLNRSARGHRLGDGTVSASTYEATVPDTSTGTGVPVEDDVNRNLDTGRDSSQPEPGRVSTGTADVLNRNLDVSQPEPGRRAYKERPTTDQKQTKSSTKCVPHAKPKTTKPAAPPTAAKAAPPSDPDPRPAVLAGITNELVDEYARRFPFSLPPRLRADLYREVDALLDAGQARDDVREALTRHAKRKNARAGLLPYLLRDVLAERHGMQTTGSDGRPMSAAAERQAALQDLHRDLTGQPAHTEPFLPGTHLTVLEGHAVERTA